MQALNPPRMRLGVLAWELVVLLLSLITVTFVAIDTLFHLTDETSQLISSSTRSFAASSSVTSFTVAFFTAIGDATGAGVGSTSSAVSRQSLSCARGASSVSSGLCACCAHSAVLAPSLASSSATPGRGASSCCTRYRHAGGVRQRRHLEP